MMRYAAHIEMDLVTCVICGTRKEKYYACPGCRDLEQQERLQRESREHAEALAREREKTEEHRFNELREADQKRQEFEQNLFEKEQAAAEERFLAAQNHQEEIAEALSNLEYKRANPGDYECPSCKYITLKRDGSRCPYCRADIPEGYWANVRTREKEAALQAQAAAKAAADEWKRGEPARLAAAAKQAAAERAAAAAATRLAAWDKFWKIYFIYLLPIFGFQAARLIGGKPDALWGPMVVFCPGLNWLAFLGLIFSGGWQILMYLLLAGGVGFIITRPFSVTSLVVILIGGFFIVGLLYTRGFTPRFIGATPIPASQAKPSFDCKQAKTPTEHLICSDTRLATLDMEMATAFREAMNRLNEKEKAELRRVQRAWVRDYTRTCNAHDGPANSVSRSQCVERYLSNRRDDLRSRISPALAPPEQAVSTPTITTGKDKQAPIAAPKQPDAPRCQANLGPTTKEQVLTDPQRIKGFQEAELTGQPVLQLPKEAKEYGVTGVATVLFTVDTDGRPVPESICVESMKPDDPRKPAMDNVGLDRLAYSVVYSSKYTAAKQDGKTITEFARLRITFLKDGYKVTSE